MLIAQISDIHLRAEGSLAYGVADTAARLKRTVEHLNRMQPQPDVVLATGDLVDDGDPRAYEHLRRLLAPLQLPIFLLPGNHDRKPSLIKAFPEHSYLTWPVEEHGRQYFCYAVETFPLRLVCLDTVTPGDHGGDLGPRQLYDLAAKNPKKLAEMKALFDEEAQKYHVYPLDDRGTARLLVPKPAPGGSDPNRKHFTYYAGAVRLAETAAPNTKNKSHTIAAEIVMPISGGEGVIVAEGGSSAGFALYVQGGKLVYEYNWFDEDRYIITSSEPVPAGKSAVRFEFAYDGGEGKGGKGTIFINGKKVGEGRIEKTVPARFGIDTFGVGMDTGSPVSNTYKPPFAFNGKIEKVEIDLR